MNLETSQNNLLNTRNTEELFPNGDLTFTLAGIVSLVRLGSSNIQELLIFPFQYLNLSSNGGKESSMTLHHT